MTEPMKCANGCGDYVWEMMPLDVVHIKRVNGKPAWRVGPTSCGKTFVATLPTPAVEPPTGIESEDIKPVEGVTREEVEGFLDDLHERPALPTSSEWLEDDGDKNDAGCGDSPCPSRSRGWVCWLSDGHDGWHVAGGIGQVFGRWYTGSPFTDAK